MKQINPNLVASFFLFFATLFWAGNFIVGKAASINEVPPISLNFYRWTIAFFILLPFTYKELILKKNQLKLIIFNLIILADLNFLFFS